MKYRLLALISLILLLTGVAMVTDGEVESRTVGITQGEEENTVAPYDDREKYALSRYINYETGEIEVRNSPEGDEWRKYIPQNSAAQNMYDFLLDSGKTHEEAATLTNGAVRHVTGN